MSAAPSIAQARAIALLSGLCLALAAACALLGWKLSHGAGGAVFFGEDALKDPKVRAMVVEKLTEGNVHPFDSHPDPDVGRLLVADGEKGEFKTNAIGMRERAFELEKPPGVVRILLVGDSYVFGLGIEAIERMGVALERALTERAAGPARFECLHFAVNSWNIASECAFVRRQVDRTRPDLVIQVSFSNDLDDVTGVRGFGAEATFAPLHSERADSILLDRYPKSFLQQDTRNFLSRGLDYESRSRFADALTAIERLRKAMAALPGSPAHLLVVHWGLLAPAIHEHLGSKLPPDSVVYLPPELALDKSTWITPSDPHWNPKGHALVAEFLYGILRARGLLPQVELGPWPEADALAADWSDKGLHFAREGDERLREPVKDPVSAIDLPGVTLPEARQVHGGLDPEGLVSPYASLVLRRTPESHELHVQARALPDRALEGAHVRIFLEELEVGAFTLAPETPLELRLPIPASLDGREYLNLRFESDDYVYRGDNLRHCVSFRLERAALE